ncbi:calcium/calmodulin-dependent protein kinase kinase cmkC [Colletotrichum spaethianum]|uniref:Calcium/calmodulin-dependent protein kinase kinase cmkC n=1 Tax=Colletotrichum spaethianum TaxID=700344 RepID=A0AA37P2K8_9PEZI|nr:calcium/calmodulin-dependent protein kinase kinase cmkC [Colletotrichum spaethianum]GKT46643.1 calcium/calmodulin-dependent protein kinase kinase cmkC [Colletotrichum spaethianum]
MTDSGNPQSPPTTAMASTSIAAPDMPSPAIAVGFHGEGTAETRPPLASYISDSTAQPTKFQSPLRHHRRTPSAHREVKETLNAVTEYGTESHDGSSHHRINQYIIKEEIGRGSYGAVHLATDQFGTEYAVKEFSKVRLRKRAQFNILRQGARRPQRFAHRVSLNAPLSPHFGDFGQESKAGWNVNDALFFIREEIAIMKKLNHPNLVQLIEVLDDPEEDSLYMVLEMCKKGVVMKVGLNEKAKPYDEDSCRYWFRDLILGIEYSDIWSMGVSLYCLRYGKIPFEHEGVLEMYEAIKTESPELPEDENPDFVDLMNRILDKDPQKRIQMSELREHPWVTKKGTDPLLSKEENCSVIVEPPNELELSRAFTRKMNHLLCVMKAIHKFKGILARQRQNSRSSRDGNSAPSTPSVDPIREDARAEDIEALIAKRREFLKQQGVPVANDKPESEPLILGIGVGARDEFDKDEPSAGDVAESPTNVDFNIYDKAYEAEVERIMKKPARQTTMYLTRFVKDREHYKEVANVVEGTSAGVTPAGTPKVDSHLTASKGRFADLVSSMTGGSNSPTGGEGRT